MDLKSRLNLRRYSLLPQTAFWRFVTATLLVGIVTATAAMLVSFWLGRGIVHEIQDEAGFSLLRGVVDMIGRAVIADENLRAFARKKNKEILAREVGAAVRRLNAWAADARAGRGTLAAARVEAFSRLSRTATAEGVPVFVIDRDLRVRASPDRAWNGRAIRDFRDAEGEPVYRELVQAARREPQSVAYDVLRLEHGDAGPRLVAARQCEGFDVTVFAEASVGEQQADLEALKQANLNELKARINEIVVARSGYLFVFDEDCRMVVHPTLEGEDFVRMKAPGSKRTLCEEFKVTAGRPWGENRLRYLWDRPDDHGNFVHPRISWCIREPTTGWYVATSAYVGEIESALPRFIWSIFLPSLGSILFLGGLLALLLRNMLKPVGDLIRVCREVSRGDLNTQAQDDAPGEMGFLCRHFNVMIQRLKRARDKDVQRQNELEDLIRNLEKIVEVRTYALRRKAANLEEANARLRELDTMKSDFLSSVSHELRTPLTSVLGFAKLINRDFVRAFWPLAEGDRLLEIKRRRILDNLEIIEREGERLTRLINDVLDLNKIESGRVDWNDRDLKVEQIVDQAVHAVSSLFAEKPDVELRVFVEPGLPSLRVDPDRLLQVLINILNNAAKFTESGSVTLEACEVAGNIRFKVADSGVGIPRQDLRKIFDKFHQAATRDTLKVKPQGTGLGLAICREIVEHYSGAIWADSEPGKGSSFFVELPTHPGQRARPAPEAAARAGPETPPRPQTEQQQEPAARPEDGSPLILVVDDDPAVNEYLRQLLEGEGYRTAGAFDGAEALRKAAELSPDLITMDLVMPVMDGETAIGIIHETPGLAEIPVFVVSVLQHGRPDGVAAAMTKPVDEERLIATVHSLLNRREARQPVLVLKQNGGTPLGRYFALSPGNVVQCNQPELWSRIEAGFEGTVVVPAFAVPGLDLARLTAQKGVHVLILPGK
jgi:signal transduction histidine kinase